MNKYKISVIIYQQENCENQVKAFTSTINSLENQGLSLQNDVQLFFMVPEDQLSKQIANMYKLVYANNLTIIYTNNEKRSITKCISQASGDYITVIKTGDVFSNKALSKAYDYFEYSKGSVDVVAMKVLGNNAIFENYNNIFTAKDENIHFMENYEHSLCPISFEGLIIKGNIAKEKAKKYDPELDEEVFLMDILRRRNTMGCLSSTSSIKTSGTEIQAVSPDHFAQIVMNTLQQMKEVTEENKYIPAYIQYTVMCKILKALNNAEKIMDVYHHPDYDYSVMWKDFSALMKYIDDDIIMSALTTRFNKMFMLYYKYERYCELDKYLDNAKMCYKMPAYFISSFPARFELMDIAEGKLIIEGLMHFPVCIDADSLKIMIDINGTLQDVEMVERLSDRYYYERPYLYEKGFKIEIPLEDNRYNIQLVSNINGVLSYNKKFEFMEICSISNSVKEDYFWKDNYAVTVSQNSIVCKKCSEEERTVLEEKLQKAIQKAEKARAKDIIDIRNFYWDNYNKKEKQIWLITDRPDRADDNAEAFFRYMSKRAEEGIDLYFILSSESSSYNELSSIGKVIEPFSSMHLKLQTIADYVISSQFSMAVFNPYNDDVKYMRGLFRNPDFIFLQHGVTHNMNGKIMGKYGRNFYGIVTTAMAEYNQFLDPIFHYTEKQVWLTGFPRWDRLYRDPKKIITIMPTWRKFLTTREYDSELKTYIWRPIDNFTESQYFNFYYSLINSPELLDAADQYGYKVVFMPHVIFLKLADKFHSDPRTVICEYEKSYREIFAESNLIVTDYSSIFFDFAYMKEPVVYCQFDKEEFYQKHTVKKGYFDHERDGFGEVTYDLKSTIATIIEYMKNDCQLKPKYLKRIEDFFDYSDKSCCERVYETIREHEDKSKIYAHINKIDMSDSDNEETINNSLLNMVANSENMETNVNLSNIGLIADDIESENIEIDIEGRKSDHINTDSNLDNSEINLDDDKNDLHNDEF